MRFQRGNQYVSIENRILTPNECGNRVFGDAMQYLFIFLQYDTQRLCQTQSEFPLCLKKNIREVKSISMRDAFISELKQ